jgi:hypothetical protein
MPSMARPYVIRVPQQERFVKFQVQNISFIYATFKDADSSSDGIASNGRMIKE